MSDELNDDQTLHENIFNSSSCLTLDQLIAYVENKISREERFEVEKHLVDCELCSDALDGLTSVSNKEKVRESVRTLNEEISARFASSPTKKTNDWRMYYSIAAILVAVLLPLFYIFNNDPSPEVVFSTYYTPYPNSIPIVRGDEAGMSELEKAMIKYESEDYESSLEILQNILKEEPDKMAVQFYSGIASLEMDKVDQSIIHFQEVTQNASPDFRDHAQWYLGLAYLKSKDIDTAKVIFNQITSTDSAYKQRSIELLNDLK